MVGPDGSIVTLRGVSKSGLEYSVNGYDVSKATFERMRSWGANVVRVALSDRFALPEMCDYDAAYLSTIDLSGFLGPKRGAPIPAAVISRITLARCPRYGSSSSSIR